MSGVYQRGKLYIVRNTIDIVGGGGVVVMPMSSSYSPDAKAHDVIADISSHELDADGYSGGFGGASRKTPQNRVARRDDPNGRVEYDFDDITWSSLGGGVSANNDEIGYFVLAVEDTDDASSPLVGWDSLQDNRETNGSDITYSPSAEGMLQFT